ncbi:Serine/threonine protein kinase [Nonomuraea maritima]|uniref:Serine/threonine protein kinase n=1 Tax=Nonomuraea maritima TaxID=683260 RepID=A0A1G9PHF8_9ACTN|nr:serine/threonine-protein kinase [Nonomuraea maritima]SDL98228.1 Serine/threonine protein kinase [Nonomuraea maritima]
MSGETSHLGPYKLLSVLGRGGMGTVHLAEDPSGQRVAIKVINPELSQHEQFRMRFRREAEAAQRVRRFCTAAVIEAALDGDQLYVVTEYVPGPNLEAAVQQSGPLRGSSLDALAVSVATALTAIHSAGVVHRDLKPSNVLLSPVGPRVIDFGIARALDTLGGVTTTGELVGTPRYMAPEVLQGEPVSPACDVFSWGCLIAFAATGRSPFGGETLAAIVYQVLNNEPDLDAVEPGLRELVKAALQKSSGPRPTAQQLLDHLVGRSAAPELAARTVQVSWQERGTVPYTGAPAPPKRRRRLYMGLAAAAVLALGAGAGAWLLLAHDGPPELEVLYTEDFSRPSGWAGVYDAEEPAAHGYRADGTYGLDVQPGRVERWAQAPAPYVVRPPRNSHEAATSPPMLPETVVISVTTDIRQVSGIGEYGLYCHSTEDGSYYEFGLDTRGTARIRRVFNGLGSTLSGPVRVDGLPARARLTVACEQVGTSVRLTMWVNGTRVQQVEDPSGIGNGYLGVFARTTKDGSSLLKTTFDDFELRGNLRP